MEKDVLKVFASTYVTESDLTVDQKVELINFIRVAEKDDILALLVTGSPVLTESASVDNLVKTELFIESVIDEYSNSFAHNYDDYGRQIGKMQLTGKGKVAASIAAATVAAAAVAGAYKIYKNYFSKAARACKGKEGDAKQACMKKFKADAVKAEISALKSGMSKCAKSKDPAKCKAAIQKKIQGLQAKGK
jgi:hypothetical protein